VCVKQLSRRIQGLSIDDAGRHGDVEFASEPLELHVLDACLAEGSRLRRYVPEEKREELFFLIAKVDTLFVPEELPEVTGRRKPSRSISVRGSTPQTHCLHESSVMVVRERDQGGVAVHSMTLRCSVVRAALGELTRRRHDESATLTDELKDACRDAFRAGVGRNPLTSGSAARPFPVGQAFARALLRRSILATPAEGAKMLMRPSSHRTRKRGGSWARTSSMTPARPD